MLLVCVFGASLMLLVLPVFLVLLAFLVLLVFLVLLTITLNTLSTYVHSTLVIKSIATYDPCSNIFSLYSYT